MQQLIQVIKESENETPLLREGVKFTQMSAANSTVKSAINTAYTLHYETDTSCALASEKRSKHENSKG